VLCRLPSHHGWMTGATHATVMTLRRDLSKAEKQRQSFREMFERGFAEIPGFVSGLWTFDPEACEVVIVHTFDSLAAAEGFAEMARTTPQRQAERGLELLSVRVSEVLGTA
jgi:hypothetical protein